MAKILFVDDEESIRTLCSEELKEEGYEVITTGKCKDVLELIISARPSAVSQACHGAQGRESLMKSISMGLRKETKGPLGLNQGL